MDAFENIVGFYLNISKNWWVNKSVKIEITPEDKKKIGKPTMPRPELDLVGFNPKENILYLIEVKSYLDSVGVQFDGVSGKNKKNAKLYKLFTNVIYRGIVSKRLKESYLRRGLINKNTRLNYVLVAGKIHSDDELSISKLFEKKGWIFIPPSEIKKVLKQLAEWGWQNDEVVMTAKMILRN